MRDIDRINALPRRKVDDAYRFQNEIIEHETALYRKVDVCQCQGRCINRLLFVQAWALLEARETGQCVASAGVGSGKTGLNFLMPLALDSKVCVLLLPAELRDQLANAYGEWCVHFKLPSLVIDSGKQGFVGPEECTIHALSYSKLARPEATDLLEKLSPDLIVADEAHKLRYMNTATTARVFRALKADTRLCLWSGTLIAKSVTDVGHLLAGAMSERSPLPLHHQVLEAWACATDEQKFDPPKEIFAELATLRTYEKQPLESAIFQRIAETPGFIATRGDAVSQPQYFHRLQLPTPSEKLQTALKTLECEWVRPDGEELLEILDVALCSRELCYGFYYQWVFPNGESEEDIERWLFARKEWHKELRSKLQSRKVHLDSPALLERAAERHYLQLASEHTWNSEQWPIWRTVKDSVQPQSEPVWMDSYAVDAAKKWAKKHTGIVWYQHDAFGEALGLPTFNGDDYQDLIRETGKRSIAVSIRAHGTGKDGLQKIFCNQLIANVPSSGDALEQLLGRLHRPGSAFDEVHTWFVSGQKIIDDCLDRATLSACRLEKLKDERQKILTGSWL